MTAPGDIEAGRILLIDDEPEIRGFVSRALARAGYRVDAAPDAAQGIGRAIDGGFDLVILDLVLPDLDGREALAAILRDNPDQAIMVLSCTSDVSAKVECLDLGASDYLTKPFSLAELGARVRARLRDAAYRQDVGAPQPEVLRFGGIALDPGRLEADSGSGPVALTRLEFLLLRALMERGGGSAAKSELLSSVWGIDFDPGSNLVDVCVRRLRAKLGFDLIETVRGEGYRLAS
jgi:DNA-binding response OmpR family regulator